MNKKDMIAKVAEISGVKRSDAKKAMEATLQILGDTLQEGNGLNVPPLGKMAVNRQKESDGAYVIVAKLRRSKAMLSDEPKETSEDAEAAEATAK
ncbi:HU family DNA-binding protein [Celeribacter litoreus]|uniref:HU family DNA-binding protein n=1 Tax=Celeribacter litoreus TaxID=2876714 RepID=UPI001CCC074A|nr:HU family DNA-binding protein [Celeribacter litoreus]MCA0043621.1 HU family DNA-binding protein [Celeribacter litoreus]